VTAERDGPFTERPGAAREEGRQGGGHLDAILADVIPALAARLRASHLAELEVRTADWRVRVRRDAATAQATGPGPATTQVARGSAATAASPDQAGMARSPAVGYFLPSPSAEVGRSVRGGDLLGHVEMLGIHHDVPSPADGVVIRALAASGQAVEYGQPLVLVEAVGSIALPGPARATEVAASGAPLHEAADPDPDLGPD
jgi:acetyl-CoA carboxylase biotin carboxyl carrier protein